ncbi:MAG: hypothetical protein RL238_1908 [Actinomycetota bacterium]|jgi:uncharacterized protein
MPWKNGGGITREVVRVPADGPFDWRLSVAEVSADGPFSTFDGIGRILVLLGGAGMDLHFVDDHHVDRLRPVRDVKAFAGEAAVHATLVDGPTVDLNLMWRRDGWDASVRESVLPVELDAAGAVTVVYVADGAAVLPDGTVLTAGDALDTAEGFVVDGTGVVVVFTLWPR